MKEHETPQQIRVEIEATRANLSQTLMQLTDRLDVKAQAERRVERARHSATGRVHSLVSSLPEPVRHAGQRVAARSRPVLRRATAALKPYRGYLAVAAVIGASAATMSLRRERRS